MCETAGESPSNGKARPAVKRSLASEIGKAVTQIDGEAATDRRMHLIERYQRVDQNTPKLNFTIDDPKAYTQPWVSDTKLFSLSPASKGTDSRSFLRIG